MRKCYFVAIVALLLSVTAGAVPKTWSGGATGNWGVAGNWTPSGIPGTSDDVTINTGTTITLDVAPNILSLLVTGSVNVTLASSVSRNITVSSTSGTIRGFQLDAGSTLILDCTNTSGTNNLVLNPTGNAGVTCLVNGNLHFTASGNSGSSAARFSTFGGVVAFADFQVGSTGYIKFFNNSGNASTSATSFTMQGGATYEIAKNGGSFPAGSYASTSLCIASGATLAGPSFLGTAYGNLQWNCPGQTTAYGFNGNLTFNDINIISCGSTDMRVKTGGAATSFTLTVNGNLQLASGTTLLTTSSTVVAPNGGTILLKGNLINNGLLSESGPSGTKDTLELGGTALQTLSGTGTVTNQLALKMNNAAGAQLAAPLSLPHHLSLKTGTITTDATNLLTLQGTCGLSSDASAWYTNLNGAGFSNFGNESSYIIGPVRKLGLSAATVWAFPVGSASQFRPFFLTNVTGDFTGEYIKLNPRTAVGNVMSGGLDHVSAIEYWQIDDAISPTANVMLSYYDPNSGGVTVMADLRVARWDGAQWLNEGQISTIGTPGTNGSVSSNTVTNYGSFTLASVTTNNPLPLKNIVLNGNRAGNDVRLSWNVEGDEEVDYYVPERSGDGRQFTAMPLVSARRLTGAQVYGSRDAQVNGVQYYRIKAVLRTGEYCYSPTLKLDEPAKGLQIFPNPAADWLQVNAGVGEGQIRILNQQGQLVLQQRLTAPYQLVNIKTLPAGRYQVVVSDAQGKRRISALVKE
jgi:hypothetical protein